MGQRSLRLQPDQVLDRVDRRQARAVQQQLPSQRGPVELPTVGTIRTHRVSIGHRNARNKRLSVHMRLLQALA